MADAQDLDITHPHAIANVGDVENTTVTRVLTVAGGVLAAWIPVLYLRLDAQRVDPASIAAWLGLDVSELLALTALVLATSRRAAATRLIGLVAATLFVLDAVTDIASATTTSSLATAVAMALAAEIPVALGCLRLALMHDAPATTTQLAHVSS